MTTNSIPPQVDADGRTARDRRTVWLIVATVIAVLLCLLITFLLVRAAFPGGEAAPTIDWATPTPTVDEVEGTLTVMPDTAACEPDAEYVADVTIPDDTVVSPGETFLKTWRVRNSGTCPWTEGYVLRFTEGAQMGGPASVPLPAANPGEVAEISVSLTAPSEPGRYRGDWRLCVGEAACFGPRLYLQIVVGATPTAETTPETTPSPTATVVATAEVTASPPAPTVPPDATSTPPVLDPGASEWLVGDGRRLGVHEVAWDTALNGWEVDEGSIYLSLYLIAETTTESSATFNALEISVMDGAGDVYTTVILERKEPPFGLCVARPGEPCEGWWTTRMPDRPESYSGLILRWEYRLFTPPLETPIR
jgi:hypothetical protein